MNLPIVCFDFDGTLVDDRGRIHPKDLALLADPEPPVDFICTTGRPLESLRVTLQKNGLFVDRPIRWPLVLQNGALIFAPGERKLGFSSFVSALQKEIITIARKSPQISFLFLSDTVVYILGEHSLGLKLARRFEFVIQPFKSEHELLPFSKVMCISDSPAELRTVADQARRMPVDGAYSMPTIFEITPKGINKASGLKKLLKQLGREDEPYFAAGDGENDLELLQQARASFAPAAAPENIKKIVLQLVDVGVDGLFEPILKTIHAFDKANANVIIG